MPVLSRFVFCKEIACASFVYFHMRPFGKVACQGFLCLNYLVIVTSVRTLILMVKGDFLQSSVLLSRVGPFVC